MGAGKTSAAIHKMNTETDKKFIFLTQTLDETGRIRNACKKRRFTSPVYGEGGKMASLHDLLRDGANISTTHALFYRYTDETLEYIKSNNYCLILDEVIDIVKFLDVTPDDIISLLDSKLIDLEPDTNRVIWAKDGYKGVWKNLKNEIESSCVTYEDGKLLVWMMPIEMFTAFKEVLVLTYMFRAQYQYYYYILHNIDIQYIGVEKDGDSFIFTKEAHAQKINLPPIHIYEEDDLNRVGEKYFSLSVTWHKDEHNKNKELLEQLRKNLYNYFTNKTQSKSNDRLWSTYESTYSFLKGNGYTKRYTVYNLRATNEYANCSHLAYLVNVFPHVDTQMYFEKRGFEIDRDALATSDMVQWLWRSRLRKGGEIWLYLPSRRMRELLQKWIKEISILEEE